MKKNAIGFLVVLVVLIGGVMLFRMATKPKPIPNPFATQSRAHLPFEEFVKTLSTVPGLGAKLNNTTSPDEATAMGFAISQAGLKRLDDAQLAKWMDLVVKMVEHLDERTCASMSRADPSVTKALTPNILRAIEKMSSADIRAYFDLTVKSVQAEMKQTPVPEFSKVKAERAMRMFIRKFSPEEQALLLRVSLYPSTASDSSACWIVKTVFSEIMELPAAERQILSRLFAQPPEARS